MFCEDCEDGSDGTLPFVYCWKCKRVLDEKDPSMNLDLLKVFVTEDKRKLVAQLGVERLFELD